MDALHGDLVNGVGVRLAAERQQPQARQGQHSGHGGAHGGRAVEPLERQAQVHGALTAGAAHLDPDHPGQGRKEGQGHGGGQHVDPALAAWAQGLPQQVHRDVVAVPGGQRDAPEHGDTQQHLRAVEPVGNLPAQGVAHEHVPRRQQRDHEQRERGQRLDRRQQALHQLAPPRVLSSLRRSSRAA